MLPNTSEADLNDALTGLRVTSVTRHGKYLLLDLENEASLAIHRKMSGNLLLEPAEAPRALHTHLVLDFDNGTSLRLVDPRKFGRVYLFRSKLEVSDFIASHLGPDSLLDVDDTTLASMLARRRGRIKPLLLNQAFLAGVGNLYADEALWDARIHPLRSAESLSKDEVRRLARAVRAVLASAIERRGTSFSTYRDSDGSSGENQDYLNAYGREGLPCARCGAPIKRIVIGQRSSFFCSKEQRLRGEKFLKSRLRAKWPDDSKSE